MRRKSVKNKGMGLLLAVTMMAGSVLGNPGTAPSASAAASTVAMGKGSYSTEVKGSYTYYDGSGNLVTRQRIDDLANLPYRSKSGNVYVTDNYTGPIDTSDWATSFLWGNQGRNPYSNPAFAFPLAYQASEKGMIVTNPSTIVDNINNTYMMGIAPTDLVVKPTGFSPADAKVDKTTDWTYDIVMSQGNMSMKTTMSQGSPYGFFEFANTGMQIEVVRGLPAKIVYGNPSSNQIVLAVYDNQDEDYNYYGFYAPAGTTWSVEYTSRFGDPKDITSLTANFPSDRKYFTIAMLPDGEAATAQLFGKYAYNFITDTKTTWSYNESTAQLTTNYQITTVNKAESRANGTISGILPHQYKNMSGYNYLPYTYHTLRGTMKLLETANYSTTLTYRGILPFMPGASAESTAQLNTYVNEFINETAYMDSPYIGDGLGDTYWTGKQLNRLVNILPVAEQLGRTEDSKAMLNGLKAELENWFSTSDSEQDKYFYYDKEVGTLIGFPASFGSETEINDHHFHYGYWIMAAAQIALRDPAWASDSNWGSMVKELITDIANTDRNSSRYPYLRNFSPYEGHSWASGHGTFGDGNNQESSSEALNAWAGIILFGEATGNTELRDLGIYLYTTEISAVENYWFDLDKDILSPAYRYDDKSATAYDPNRKEVRNQASMVWGGKYIYGTWWTAEPLQVQGINLLPMTGASLYLAHDKDYIVNNFNLAREKENSYTGADKMANPYDRWNDIWTEYLALADPYAAEAAWLSTAAVEGGESRAHTYNFIKALQTYGTPNSTITSNAVQSSVFEKNGVRYYAACNASDSNKTVIFSDGARITVKAHSFHIGTNGSDNLNSEGFNYESTSGGQTTPTVPEVKGVDLIVTDIQVSSTVSGEEVTFTATIKNQGSQASPANVKHGLSFWIDGTCVNWCDTFNSSLAPGQTAVLTANSGPNGKASWTAVEGSHQVMAFIDDVFYIEETNEDNNKYNVNMIFKTSGGDENPGTQTPENPVSGTGMVSTGSNSASAYYDDSSWVDIHYVVNNGAQMNVRMIQNGTRATYEIGGLNAGDKVSYWFTACDTTGRVTDTSAMNYTHQPSGGSSSGNTNPGGTEKVSVPTDLNKVNIYQDINYGGYGLTLDEGSYTLGQLLSMGVKNDDITSVKVPLGYKVTLYENDNFQGSTKVLTADTAYVGADFNDKMSSIKVEKANYYIVNRHSGKALSIYNSSKDNGANLVQWDNNGKADQQWQLTKNNNGYYYISSVMNGKVIDISDYSTADGGNIHVWDNVYGSNQQWAFNDAGNGYFSIVSPHSGKALDVADWSTGNGGNIQQWSYGNTANQQWQLILAN